MLEGINVLSQSPIMTSLGWVGLIVIIGLVIAFIGVMKNAEEVMIISVVITVLFWIFFNIIKVPTDNYTYKVTIDDNVSLNEFNQRYEIIEQDGLIYTIKLKEVE